jgi:SNF2 family DNA or RNA helicase
MSLSAAVNSLSGRIEIVLPVGSPLLSGKHRIFFVNILDLEELSSSLGYFSQGEDGSMELVLKDVLEYLNGAGVTVNLNEAAQQSMDALQQGKEDFDEALAAGVHAQSMPPEHLSIPGFRRTLKTHQVASAAHMVSVGNSANFSVPGSGKTTTTYAGYALLKGEGLVNQLVVIGPRAAFRAWEDEYVECFGKKANAIRVTGNVTTRKKLYRQAKEAELILLTYQMASQDKDRLAGLLRSNKAMLVLDESHYVKRFYGGKWSNAVLDLAPLAAKRAILTGTPVPHGLLDLWVQMSFLWPGGQLLGTQEEYKNRVHAYGDKASDHVRKLISPFYTRTKKGQLRLKAPKFNYVNIQLRPYQRAIYDAVAVKVLADLIKAPEDRADLRSWRKARVIRLLQIASNPTLLTSYSEEFKIPPLSANGLSVGEIIARYPDFETAPKVEAAVKLCESLLAKGHKVLLWTSFIHNIKSLQHLLRKHQPRVVYGSIPKDDSEDIEYNRERMIHEFKTSKRYNLLIANPAACAESVSLHKICHHAVYMDRTFNCAQYMQSLDRIHRIGLAPSEQVYYHILTSPQTIDAVVQERLEQKQRNMMELLEDDLASVDLDYTAGDLSEESEEAADFNAIIAQLRAQYS